MATAEFSKFAGILSVMWCWSNFKEKSHVQGQRRSHSNMVGGVKFCLESNPRSTRDSQRAQNTLCAPEPRDPTKIETELCFSVSCGGMDQQWIAAAVGALGALDLGGA